MSRPVAEFLSGESEEQMSGLTAFISEFMIPTKDFFVTPILIDLNIFIFLFLFLEGHGFMSVKNDDLMLWGANYSPLSRTVNIGGSLRALFYMEGLFI